MNLGDRRTVTIQILKENLHYVHFAGDPSTSFPLDLLRQD